MHEDYWAAVEELFCDVAAADPVARAQLLNQRRSLAPQVVAEVESLLASNAEASQFLNTVTVVRASMAPPAAPRASPPAPAERASDRRISHYRLCEWLGAGGMGEVYRAEDLALGREAALKLLPDGVDPELRALLLREADASARLQHPAIATFYEAGEADGEAFIAMEFVRGQVLRQRLDEGVVPIEQALTIARCLLEALAHAHTAGILHRDIKPENIIITSGGTAKLLDFGIAKRLFVDTAETTLSAGIPAGGRSSVVGTLGYFAPEQILGETLDARTDLFQVGLVLFEMLTTQPAYPGSSLFERLTALVTKSPDFDLVRRLDASGELVRVLGGALTRKPSDRYPSAAAFLRDLQRLSSTPTTLPSTLAVLDLGSAGGQREDAWIGSGIADRLAADLARVPGATVVAREKVLSAIADAQAANPEAASDAREIGRRIGCRWLVTGTFERAGSSLRLNTALIDVATGETLAAEHLDGPMQAIFDMQERLSRAIVGTLDLHIPVAAAGGGRNVQAFEYYARGRRLWQRLEKGSIDHARELYERAIEVDPTYARALSGLAAVHAMRYPFTTDDEDLAKAVTYAERAIAVDPQLGDAYTWLGYALMRQNRFDEALQVEQLAAALDPNHPYPPYFAACTHAFAGRPAEAVPLLRRAIEIAPTHAFAWMVLGSVHTSLGNFMEARWCLERALSLEHTESAAPTVAVSALVAECLRLEGRLEDARIACLRALESVERSDHMFRDSFRGMALCCLARTAFDQGDVAAARAALHQVLAHVQGRERALGGGHLVVQALAGLARAGESVARFNEAHQLFAARDRFNFSAGSTTDDATTLTALAQAARALGLPIASDLLIRARDAGSYEARVMLGRTG
jgi:tetratricopeptide (TPR) repeat protein